MNILIVNVHSALNLGDEGIMYETLRRLKVKYPEATVTVAANDPRSWHKYDDVHVISSMIGWMIDQEGGSWQWRKSSLIPYAMLLVLAAASYRLFRHRLVFGRSDQRSLLKAYYDSDLVVSCGGGNFYAHKQMSPSFVWSLLTLAFAHWLEKRVVLLPQSIGPIEGRFQRFLARLMFSRVARILVRERRSLAFLEELGVHKPVLVVPDLAFGVPSLSSHPDLCAAEDNTVPRIGVTVIDRAVQTGGRFARQQAYEDILVSVLTNLSAMRDAQIYFFVQCAGPTRDQDDTASTRRVYGRVSQFASDVFFLDSFEDAIDIKSSYGQMDCVIASRMHTGIFALSSSVPVVLIAYQPKALGVMEMFELEQYCCNIETVTENELSRLALEILDNKDQVRLRITRRLAAVQRSLEGWTRHLED